MEQPCGALASGPRTRVPCPAGLVVPVPYRTAGRVAFVVVVGMLRAGWLLWLASAGCGGQLALSVYCWLALTVSRRFVPSYTAESRGVDALSGVCDVSGLHCEGAGKHARSSWKRQCTRLGRLRGQRPVGSYRALSMVPPRRESTNAYDDTE